MGEYDPNKRAELDDQQAAQERSEAHDMYRTAGNLGTTADNLRTMGFGEAGDVLEKTADWAAAGANVEMQAAAHMTDAADHWRTVAHDLDGQAKATGEACLAEASHQANLERAQRAATDDDRLGYEAQGAAAATLEAGYQHQATAFGQDAQTAAATALADEKAAAEGE